MPCGGTTPDKIINAKGAWIKAVDVPETVAAGILGPVFDLLVPSVLHVLALDSQAALKQYQELYNYGNEDMLKIARLQLVYNVSRYLGMLVMPRK